MAAILVQMMIASFLMDAATFWAALARVSSRNLHDAASSKTSLVSEELFQLIKSPGTKFAPAISVTVRKIRFFKRNTGKVFNCEKRIRSVFLDKCLR